MGQMFYVDLGNVISSSLPFQRPLPFLVFVQDELRCRELEMKANELSARVKAAEVHSTRLERLLEEARGERDLLKVKVLSSKFQR